MTFVLHLFGLEIARFTFGELEEAEPEEFVSNTGGDFELQEQRFGFCVPETEHDEEE